MEDDELRFAFQLCRDLGYAHPDHLFAELSYAQFLDWAIAYELEPWGEHRADLRMARQVWATFQASGARKVPDESRYLLRFGAADRPKTPEEYRHKAMAAWVSAGGGMVISTP